MRQKHVFLGLANGAYCAWTLSISASSQHYAAAATVMSPPPGAHLASAIPNGNEISANMLSRLSKLPIKSVDRIKYNRTFAIVIYNTGETGGSALYHLVNGHWVYLCASKGALGLAYAENICGISAAQAKLLFPYNGP